VSVEQQKQTTTTARERERERERDGRERERAQTNRKNRMLTFAEVLKNGGSFPHSETQLGQLIIFQSFHAPHSHLFFPTLLEDGIIRLQIDGFEQLRQLQVSEWRNE
jgi:hypothetical protein